MPLKTKLPLLCLAVAALAAAACSDDSVPFGPESLAKKDLAFFPLRKGYKVDYNYYFSEKLGYEIITGGRYENNWRKDGEFHLEVIDTYTKESEKEVFYKIRTVFVIKATYSYKSPSDTTWISRTDTTTTTEHYIMQTNGSLWYVTNAPSFERLEEGDTTLMMASPVASGGEMHLLLFPAGVFGSAIYRYQGDISVDNSNICGYCDYPSGCCYTEKNKGITLIEDRSIIDSQSNYDESEIRLELIE
ncbi:hypothetical protein LLH00_14575 [bacterium]|nr:hypothetical protein [bacterium]